jgi:uncharacterized membrane protein YbhN (UPF0104 family)
MRTRAWTIARWALGIGVVALIVVGFDAPATVARITAANGLLVVVGVLGLTAVHALGAWAWAILCRQLAGLRLGRLTALRLYYAAQALGGVTPGNVGGDAYRVVALRNAGQRLGPAIAPVLVQRATSYLALALLALPAVAILALASHVSSAVLLAGLIVCGVAGGVAVALLVAPAKAWELWSRLPWVHAQPDAGADRAWTTVPARSVATGVAFGLAFHAASVLLTAVLVAAVDPSAVGPAVLAAIVLARLSLAIPILPSGLGANEAILAISFAGLGFAPQTALAALLLGRLALLLTTVIGASLLLVGRGAVPAEQRIEVAAGEHA